MSTADRLTMPLGEAIFSLRAIRRLKPDPMLTYAIFWKPPFAPQTVAIRNPGTLWWSRMLPCVPNSVPYTTKPGGPNGAMRGYKGPRIPTPLSTGYALGR